MVSNGSNSAPNTASPAINKRNTYHTALSNTLANLDMNQEIKFDLRNEDLKDLHELGQGNGGSVKKVEHIPTGTLMAKKVRIHYFSRRVDISSPHPDRAYRRQTCCAKADPPRAADHA
jgi:hypothetical protein